MIPTKPIPIALNVALLKRQKAALIRAIKGEQRHRGDAALLDGILNMLDHIHDSYDPPAEETA